MLNFEIPDSTTNLQINLKLIKSMREYPHLFLDNVSIEAVYGCPPKCIWNGGCVRLPGEKMSSQDVENVFQVYNDNEVSYRLTFTNRLLEESHLKDLYGNMISKIGNSSINAVIVATDMMQQYICNNYKQYNIIQSICRMYKNLSEINTASEKNLVCLPIGFNNDWLTLKSLAHPKNAIVLINEYCPISNCEFCQEHYESFSRIALGTCDQYIKCKHQELKDKMLKNNESPNHNVFPTNYRRYEELGITHFKLNGRASSPKQLAALYVKYFAKKEYQNSLYQTLLDF